MKKIILLFIFTALIFEELKAQGAYAPYNRDYYHIIERYEILKGEMNPIFHTGFKPYRRDKIASYLESYLIDSTSGIFQGSKADQFNINYLTNDNW
jgi:hypothetical protein